MSKFKPYIKTQVTYLRPYEEGEVLSENVSISQFDLDNGSPKIGDMIARNPDYFNDGWLVAKEFFINNYKEREE